MHLILTIHLIIELLLNYTHTVQALNMLYVAHLCTIHSAESTLTSNSHCGSLINLLSNSYNFVCKEANELKLSLLRLVGAHGSTLTLSQFSTYYSSERKPEVLGVFLNWRG